MLTPVTDGPAAAETRPGLAPARLAALMEEAVARCDLDLTGAVVLTEAASGAYVVTPLLAAMAGADRVIAVTRTTRHGTAADVARSTSELARRLGIGDRVRVTDAASYADLAAADVVTNSGHLRPIDAEKIAALRPTAVVPLMFEAWEVQAGRFDVDLGALRARGIAFAGTNERHPAVDVFSFLGLMAVRLLVDAGIAPYSSRLGVLCDNPFREFLVRGLAAAGASVTSADTVGALECGPRLDAVLVALRPRGTSVLGPADVAALRARWPGVVVAQFWGDVDRAALSAAGLRYWPDVAPPPGHMGVLPSDVGPEPIVRLQAGGLKVGQVLRSPTALRTREDREFLDVLD